MQSESYLTFNGQCEQPSIFTRRFLGGKIEMMRDHADTPMRTRSAEWRKKIVHARRLSATKC